MKNKEIEEIHKQISNIWDQNIEIRTQDLENGTDNSYLKIIVPYVLNMVIKNTSSNSSILDIGCGCGYLTNKIYQEDRKKIMGLDISRKSIKYAKDHYPEVTFIQEDIYNFNAHKKYDFCLSVMTLNNTPDVGCFLSAAHKSLKKKGYLFVILPHPCFWPFRHIKLSEFNYSKNASYSIPFKTKGRKDYASPILYFHRSLDFYLKAFIEQGFRIIQCDELLENNGMDLQPDMIAVLLCK